ncbi:MAG: hypothetical protein ABIC04_07775 [Nanoarchaeota archaeon]
MVFAKINVVIESDPSYVAGDRMEFEYIIYSDVEQNITYVEEIICPTAPLPLLQLKTAVIGPENPLTGKYESLIINEDIEPQECEAAISIKNPEEIREEKKFSIVTLPRIDFRPIFCKDKICSEQSKVFVKDEKIYVNSESEIADITLTGVLIFPTGESQQLILPSYIDGDLAGSYTIFVTASKEGYKMTTEALRFAVIEKSAEIKSISECNADGICSEDEDEQKCPQDCKSSGGLNYCRMDNICDNNCDDDPDCVKEEVTEEEGTSEDVETKKGDGWIVIVLVAVLLIGLISYFRITKK